VRAIVATAFRSVVAVGERPVVFGVVSSECSHFKGSVNFHPHSQNGGREADFSLDG